MCFRERQKHFLSRAWIFSVFRHRLTEIYVGIYSNTVFHFEANKRALKLLKTGKYLLEFDISQLWLEPYCVTWHIFTNHTQAKIYDAL